MPAIVQTKNGTQTTGTSWSLTFDSSVTAGNRLIAVIRCQADDGTDLAVTAGTWEKVLSEASTNAAVAVFSREATGGDGALTVTVSTTNSDPGVLDIFEVSDCGAIDQNATATGTSTSAACGPITPTDTDHFAVASAWTGGTDGGGETFSSLTLTNTTGSQGMTGWGVRSSGAAYTETMSWTTSRVYAGILAVFLDGASDVTAPTCSINAVHGAGEAVSVTDAGGYNSTTEELTITGTAADAVGVTSVEVQIDGGSWVAATGTTSWSYVLDLTTLSLADVHTIDARASDAAANVGNASQVSFYYSPSGVWVFGGVSAHLKPSNYDVWTAP